MDEVERMAYRNANDQLRREIKEHSKTKAQLALQDTEIERLQAEARESSEASDEFDDAITTAVADAARGVVDLDFEEDTSLGYVERVVEGLVRSVTDRDTVLAAVAALVKTERYDIDVQVRAAALMAEINTLLARVSGAADIGCEQCGESVAATCHHGATVHPDWSNCAHGVPDGCRSYRCGSNCNQTYDRMHPCLACTTTEAVALRMKVTEKDTAYRALLERVDFLKAQAQRQATELARATVESNAKSVTLAAAAALVTTRHGACRLCRLPVEPRCACWLAELRAILAPETAADGKHEQEVRTTERHRPDWEGPISDATMLDAMPQGSVAIDDVGSMRQLRFGNSYMGGGWTAHGNDPLSSRELVEDGARPVWVMRGREMRKGPSKTATPSIDQPTTEDNQGTVAFPSTDDPHPDTDHNPTDTPPPSPGAVAVTPDQ